LLYVPGRLPGSEITRAVTRRIVGAFLATFIGQAIGWYRADQGAGFIGATVGAVIVLFVCQSPS
jgi:uncharacterized membrane protein YeaQ/YmgE (transglycosylase-associated protein family)